MNYNLLHDNIIDKARLRNNGVVKHHIIPRSCNGSNDKVNLVLLTHKEHFVIHHLLTKMFRGINRKKMVYAFRGMVADYKNRGNNITASQYQKLLSEANKIHSKRMKGKNNPMYGMHLHISEEQKEKHSKLMKGRVAHNKGIPMTKEQKKNLSLKMKDKTGTKNSFYGRNHSEKSKKKMSESLKIYWAKRKAHTTEHRGIV